MNNIRKLRIRYVSLFILILICAFSIGLTNSRYTSSKKIDDTVPIAKPIVEFVSVTEPTINNMIPGQTIEYEFNIKNTDGNLTNEVLINYYIKLTAQDSNLPVTYKIYDITNGTEKELPMTSNQTALISLGYENVENHKYKIQFKWPEESDSLTYADKQMNFNLDVYAEQVVE